MKKAIVWLLALTLATGLVGSALAEEDLVTITAFDSVDDSVGMQAGTELIVGSTTAMSGYFGTDCWGNNTSDMDVRSLLHGYSTVAWTRTLGLAMDGEAVAGVETEEQADGSRVYTIELTDTIAYNDGTPITAQDYVFSLLLTGAPELRAIGGTPKGMDHLVGYAAYQTGAADKIAGVRLLSDRSFSLHISADYLPFFYGLAMLNVTPYPISAIAPGCVVRDDGDGVYLAASDAAGSIDASGYTPGEFSEEMLTVTLLDPESGYEFNPRLTSGPYKLEGYDQETHTAIFSINEYYRGNYEGQRPHIERLVFKHVQNETMIQELENGEVDLLNKVANGEAIARGQVLAMQEGRAQAATYLRTGFSFLAFACEEGPTASTAVRRAVAMSIDKDALTAQVAGGSARRVYGYYGLGQWMATYAVDANDATGQAAMNMSGELAKLDVPQDIEGAKTLLASDGWTLNASGDAYTEGTDTVRYRDDGQGGLEKLEIRWAKTADSAVADALEAALTDPLAELGMELDVTELSFGQMLRHYYRQEPRTYNMFYLASNFTYVFDPYYDFNTAESYQGMVNASGLQDEELMRLALDMRETPSTDMYGYAKKWLAFQQRFVELMPMVPLYSNVYFDFYINELQDYDISSHSGWGLAILYAWVGDAQADAGEGEEVVYYDENNNG